MSSSTERPSAPTLFGADDVPDGLPRHVAPMRARLAAAPFNSPDHLFEVKWDGIRATLARDRGAPRLLDRGGADLLRSLPEMRDVRLPEGIVLDGEIIVCDARGRPSYELLAGRVGPRAAMRGRGPVFVAFDLLYEDRRPLLARPLEERRRRLRALGIHDRHVAVPDHLENDGEPFFDAVEEYGLEGLVAKHRRSPYVPGARTSDWLKVHVTPRSDVVIGGIVVDAALGARQIMCGWSATHGLTYAGDANVPAYLARWLDEATRWFAAGESPFATPLAVRSGCRWLRPVLVAIVEHDGSEDSVLHDARFRALRFDGDAATATYERPVTRASAPASGPSDRPRVVVLQSLPFGR